MNRFVGTALLAALCCAASFSRAAAEPPPDAPTDRLAAAVERLANLVERESRARKEDSASRRVEVAVAVLGLRYRKMERLEEELKLIDQSEATTREQISMIRSQMEMFSKVQPSESEMTPERKKVVVEEVERQIAILDARIKAGAERRQVVQGELENERRDVAGLEDTVSAWLEELK
jgi:predicted  nucleic acid-binding Zn-ribbon protein